jgi:predicted nucleic acid-binding protein
MLKAVFFDSGPLGLITNKKGILEADNCRVWLDNLLQSGVEVCVPEIADYEVRRELIRAGKTTGLRRLDDFLSRITYIGIDSFAMRQAANLWAQSRQSGQPTSDPKSLDGDVILVSQVMLYCQKYHLDMSEIKVASTNIRHLNQFIPVAIWSDIS